MVDGEIDVATARQFEDALGRAIEDNRTAGVAVDLAAVSFIDSTGLNALVHAFERQRLRGDNLALVVTDSRIAMMLEVSRLDRVLKQCATRADALLFLESSG